MKLTRILLFLIVFGLLIQNTCPHGIAGKTAFAAPFTHDCPMKKNNGGPGDGGSVDGKMAKLLYPAFLFSVPFLSCCDNHPHMTAKYAAFNVERYENPCKDHFTRPPAL